VSSRICCNEASMEFPLIILLLACCAALVFSIHSAWKWKNREKMLQRIIQASPIPTFVIRKDHRVLLWNQALEKLSHIKAEEVIGTNQHWKAYYQEHRPCMADLIVDGTTEDASRWYAERHSSTACLDDACDSVIFVPKLGDTGRWCRITAAAIRDDKGEMFGAIETTEDVSDKILADEEIIRMKKLESLGTLAEGVAQDLDGLMSAALRSIFMAKLSASDEDKTVEEGLAIAEKASLQVKKLAHQLITFAKGGYPLWKKESLIPLLREAIESVGNRADIEWRISITDNLRPVEMDSKQVRQVIDNIVHNAVEVTPKGGSIAIDAEEVNVDKKNILKLREGRYIRITIKDSGSGIRNEDLSRIFDPYFTTKKTGDRKGLGLPICDSILKHHKGGIAVESEWGKGATFHLYLPADSDPIE
jgi:signal transduction histidine kinase